MSLVPLKELTKLFASEADVMLLAHHVQEPYFSKPTRSHHNPAREDAAKKAIEVGQAFQSAGKMVFATVLKDKSEYVSNQEAGLHPWLLTNADRQCDGYEESAFSNNYFGQRELSAPVRVMVGFNASQCVLQSVLDCPVDKTLVVVADGIENAVISDSTETKEQALQIMQQQPNVVLAQAKDVINAVCRL